MTPLPDKLSDLELVKAVRALYGGKPERWTQEDFAFNADGHGTDYRDSRAACWCLSGAAMRCDGSRGRLSKVLRFKTLTAMEKWNDAPGRTFAEVDARLAEAEARLS